MASHPRIDCFAFLFPEPPFYTPSVGRIAIVQLIVGVHFDDMSPASCVLAVFDGRQLHRFVVAVHAVAVVLHITSPFVLPCRGRRTCRSCCHLHDRARASIECFDGYTQSED